jgi:hypothetical protein
MAAEPVHLLDLQIHWGDFRQLSHDWSWQRALHVLNPLHWVFAPILGAGVIAFRTWRQRLREGRAASWPATAATVLSVSVKPNNGYWVTIEYRYFARDEYRYGKYLRHFRRKAAAEEFAGAVRKLQVPVHFREDDPDVSVLIERDLQFAGQMAGSLEPR